MHRAEFAWTPELVERLIAAWNDGASAAEVQIRIGAPSRSAVIGKVHRLRRDGVTLRGLKRTASSVSVKVAAAAPQIGDDNVLAKPEPVTVPASKVDVLPGAVHLLDAIHGQCRWPLWDLTMSRNTSAGLRRSQAAATAVRTAASPIPAVGQLSYPESKRALAWIIRRFPCGTGSSDQRSSAPLLKPLGVTDFLRDGGVQDLKRHAPHRRSVPASRSWPREPEGIRFCISGPWRCLSCGGCSQCGPDSVPRNMAAMRSMKPGQRLGVRPARQTGLIRSNRKA